MSTATLNCTRQRHHTRRKLLTRPPVSDTNSDIKLKQKADSASAMKPHHRCQNVGRGAAASAAVMTGDTGVSGEAGMRMSWCCSAFSLLIEMEGRRMKRRRRRWRPPPPRARGVVVGGGGGGGVGEEARGGERGSGGGGGGGGGGSSSAMGAGEEAEELAGDFGVGGERLDGDVLVDDDNVLVVGQGSGGGGGSSGTAGGRMGGIERPW